MLLTDTQRKWVNMLKEAARKKPPARRIRPQVKWCSCRHCCISFHRSWLPPQISRDHIKQKMVMAMKQVVFATNCEWYADKHGTRRVFMHSIQKLFLAYASRKTYIEELSSCSRQAIRVPFCNPLCWRHFSFSWCGPITLGPLRAWPHRTHQDAFAKCGYFQSNASGGPGCSKPNEADPGWVKFFSSTCEPANRMNLYENGNPRPFVSLSKYRNASALVENPSYTSETNW